LFTGDVDATSLILPTLDDLILGYGSDIILATFAMLCLECLAPWTDVAARFNKTCCVRLGWMLPLWMMADMGACPTKSNLCPSNTPVGEAETGENKGLET
jgi:hypothetical protein